MTQGSFRSIPGILGRESKNKAIAMLKTLRIYIPLLLFVILLLQVIFVVYFSARQANMDHELKVRETLVATLTRLQDSLEYLSRKDDMERIRHEIAALGSDPMLHHALLVNESNTIEASLRISDIGQPLAALSERQPMLQDGWLLPHIEKARQGRQGEIRMDEMRRVWFAAYPVVLGSRVGSVRPDRIGVLLVFRHIGQPQHWLHILRQQSMSPILLSMMLLTILIGVFVHYRITRRIDHLIHVTDDFARGNYQARFASERDDELGRLGAAFDNMVNEVSIVHEALQDQSRQIELLMDSTAEAIYGINTNGRCTFVNPACLRLLRYGHESELLGQDMHKLIHHSHADGSVYAVEDCAIFRAYRNDAGVHIDDEVFWCADGSHIPVEYWAHPILDEEKVVGAVVTFLDISERKRNEAELQLYREHLEQMVTLRTAELTAINKELESYSYSVSHDLRAPLRSIDGFSQIVLNDYADKLDETGKDCLQRVRRASQRMGELIDDMLNLSRVTRHKLKRSQVDLSAIAQNVAAKQQLEDPERAVDFAIQEGLLAMGDEQLLHILLENLIANAWKFTARSGQARIVFAAHVEQQESIYSVSDNGVGFDMRYVDKLFEPFQRLHTPDEFEGSGIGLATVARVIQRHGGRVWAESEENQGATIYFTLNVAAAAEPPEMPSAVPLRARGE